MQTLEQKLYLAQEEIDYRYITETLYSLLDDLHITIGLLAAIPKNPSGVADTLRRNGIYVEDDSESTLYAMFMEDNDEERGFFGKIWDAIKRMFAAIGNFFKRIFGRGDKPIDEPTTSKEEVDKKLKDSKAASTEGILCTLKDQKAIVTALKSSGTILQGIMKVNLDVGQGESTDDPLAVTGIVKTTTSGQDDVAVVKLEWNDTLVKHCTNLGITLPVEVEGGIKKRLISETSFSPDNPNAISQDLSHLFVEEAVEVSIIGVTDSNKFKELLKEANEVKKLYARTEKGMKIVTTSIERTIEQAMKSAKKDKDQAQHLLHVSGFVTSLLVTLVKMVMNTEQRIADQLIFIKKSLESK